MSAARPGISGDLLLVRAGMVFLGARTGYGGGQREHRATPAAYRLLDYGAYFNDARPHQGIGQNIPSGPPESPAVGGRIKETPILGILHHEYRRAA